MMVAVAAALRGRIPSAYGGKSVTLRFELIPDALLPARNLAWCASPLVALGPDPE
jgi:hypothetical protein